MIDEVTKKAVMKILFHKVWFAAEAFKSTADSTMKSEVF